MITVLALYTTEAHVALNNLLLDQILKNQVTVNTIAAAANTLLLHLIHQSDQSKIVSRILKQTFCIFTDICTHPQ